MPRGTVHISKGLHYNPPVWRQYGTGKQSTEDRIHEAEPNHWKHKTYVPKGHAYHQTALDVLHEAEKGKGRIKLGKKYHQTRPDRKHESAAERMAWVRSHKGKGQGKKPYHQGREDRLDEAIGAVGRGKPQTEADRYHEHIGMEKAMLGKGKQGWEDRLDESISMLGKGRKGGKIEWDKDALKKHAKELLGSVGQKTGEFGMETAMRGKIPKSLEDLGPLGIEYAKKLTPTILSHVAELSKDLALPIMAEIKRKLGRGLKKHEKNEVEYQVNKALKKAAGIHCKKGGQWGQVASIGVPIATAILSAVIPKIIKKISGDGRRDDSDDDSD